MTDFSTKTVELQLENPVELGGKTFSALSIREPWGGVLMDCGLPARIIEAEDGEQISQVDSKALGRMISVLAEVPLQVVRRLSPTDFIAAIEVVMNFFPGKKKPAAIRAPNRIGAAKKS